MSSNLLWELCRPDWTCPSCGAAANEIHWYGHRRLVAGVPVSNRADAPGSKPCPEACTCLPEHRSLAEHRLEVATAELVRVLK